MSTRLRLLAFQWLLAVVVIVNITSAKTDLETSRRYTYGETFNENDRQIENIWCQVGNICEAYCIQQNKSSAVDGNTLNDTRCAVGGYHIIFVFSKVTTLRAGWFVHNALITRITIRDSANITEIEPGAFDDCTFRHIRRLEIRGTAITFLKREALAGLNNLKSLSLYANNNMRGIEENALLGLYQLEEFTMEEQDHLSDLTNITEKIEWKYLQSLNLSKNYFGHTIVAPIFRGCTKVKILTLSNSEIEAIGPNSFEPMEHTIEILDLSNNRLRHLPGGLLGNMIRPHVQLYLSNNLWDCSCASNAMELQWYENSHPDLIIDSPLICESPLTEKGNCMINVSIECFTTPHPYVPTTPERNLNYLSCSDQTDSFEPGIAVEMEYQFFTIKQESETKVTVEVFNLDASLALVYINDHDYQSRCLYNLKRRMEFNTLNSNAGHLFCLIKKSSYTTSPRNCLPFHFRRDFIWSRDRILVTLVCSFGLAIALGIILGCLCICRYRRASRGISQQGSRDSRGKIIMDDFNAWSAYHHGKFFMHSNKSGKKLRRIASENSLASQTYMTPFPVFDVQQRRGRKSETLMADYYSMKDYIDKLPYDIVPPPLPPYNISQKERIYATIVDPAFNDEYAPYAYIKRKKY